MSQPTTRAGRRAKAALTKAASHDLAQAPTVSHASDGRVAARLLELRAQLESTERDIATARAAGQWNAVSSLQHVQVKRMQDLSRLEGLYRGIPPAPDNRDDMGAAPRIVTVEFGEPCDCPRGWDGRSETISHVASCTVRGLEVGSLPSDGERADAFLAPQRPIPALQPGAEDS